MRLLILFILFLSSCSHSSDEHLVGNCWGNYESKGYSEYVFTPDSIYEYSEDYGYIVVPHHILIKEDQIVTLNDNDSVLFVGNILKRTAEELIYVVDHDTSAFNFFDEKENNGGLESLNNTNINVFHKSFEERMYKNLRINENIKRNFDSDDSIQIQLFED